MIGCSNLKLIIIVRIGIALGAAVVAWFSNRHPRVELRIEEVDLIDIMLFGILINIFDNRLRVGAP
ncbi:hypothetical protein D3C71_1529250 [compost metagenome]